MKRFVLAVAAMVFTAGVFAQTAAKSTARVVTAGSAVKFKNLVHDFGKIKQAVPVTYEFTFTNTTDKPIVIESASASCGCTTPVWPQTPIAKGKTDKITAGFNAQNHGPFNKSIYVKVAGIDAPVEIKITGEVLNEVDYAKYTKENSKKSK